MRWKQFFTPIHSVTTEQGRKLISETPLDELTVLDVRQKNEYTTGHIPGAKLIPLPELKNRINELPRHQKILVYCAVGGRSRVAAQMLAGMNFDAVYNLKGGIKAWDHKTALGTEELGLELFTGNEAPDKSLIIAYSLEQGLRDFYLSMIPKTTNIDAQKLFQKLADIEIIHQNRLFDEFQRITGEKISKQEFEENVVEKAVEGGLTTEEYLRLFQTNLEDTKEIIALAMSIEAQSLDLYLRAAHRNADPQSKKILLQLSSEEEFHLNELGKLLDRI